ncbi:MULTISPECIES: hypothetical protein [Bacillus cereus group]|uniref:hypothetical protein n=1 Tax=Bacillus cereus group TaxID=86661 RepID=UPI0001A1080E|nr:hypothetical protein bcere0029_60080 [Bacillus cereus AH1272]
MNIQQKYGVQIWREIKRNAFKYSQKEIKIEDITHLTHVFELFYTETQEGKNRYGQVLFDTFNYINELTEKELRIDYKPKTEIEMFPELKDVWIYFINKLEDLGDRTSEEENNIVRFPPRQ